MKISLTRIFFILFFLFAFVCATPAPSHTQDQVKQSSANPLCTKRIVNIGVHLINNGRGECEVESVRPNSPAALGEMKRGDVILKIDEVEIRTRYDVTKTMRQKSSEEIISLTILRDGQILKKQIQPKFVNIFLDVLALTEIISKEQPVRLAIVIGEINNIIISPLKFEQWKEGMKSQLLVETENLFIRLVGEEKYFSIVDRQKINLLIKEFEIQQTGLISDEFRSKLGNMVGATHTIIINFSRFSSSRSSSGYEDVITRRLIEIESGKILASVSCRRSK